MLFNPFRIRSEPAAEALAAHPEVAPSPDGWDASDDVALEKPLGVEQAPDAESQNFTSSDFTGVPFVGKADDVRAYATPLASPAEVDSATDRPIIGAASTNDVLITGKAAITIAKMATLSIASFE